MIENADFLMCGTNDPEETNGGFLSKLIQKIKAFLDIGTSNVKDVVIVNKNGISQKATPLSFFPYLDFTRFPPVYKTKVRYVRTGNEEIVSWRPYQVFFEDLDIFNEINGNGSTMVINLNSAINFSSFFNLKKEPEIPDYIAKRMMKEYGIYLEPFMFNYHRVLTLANFVARSVEPLGIELAISENKATISTSSVAGNYRQMKEIKKANDELFNSQNSNEYIEDI